MPLTLTILGCQGPMPGPGGATTGYLLDDGDTRLLVDCGSGIASRIAAIGYEKPDAVILTHWHADHSADLFVLGYARTTPLPVYAPPDPKAEAERIVLLPVLEPCWYAPQDEFAIGSFQVEVQRMQHPYPSHALRISQGGHTIGFTGDTRLIDSLPIFMQGVDVMVAHTPFLHAQLQAHTPQLSCLQAAQVAQQAGVRRLVLAHHLPAADTCAYLEEAKTVFEPTLLAKEGLILKLGE